TVANRLPARPHGHNQVPSMLDPFHQRLSPQASEYFKRGAIVGVNHDGLGRVEAIPPPRDLVALGIHAGHDHFGRSRTCLSLAADGEAREVRQLIDSQGLTECQDQHLIGHDDFGRIRHRQRLGRFQQATTLAVEQPDRELRIAAAGPGVRRQPRALPGSELNGLAKRRRYAVVIGHDHLHEARKPLVTRLELNANRSPAANLVSIARAQADPDVLDFDVRRRPESLSPRSPEERQAEDAKPDACGPVAGKVGRSGDSTWRREARKTRCRQRQNHGGRSWFSSERSYPMEASDLGRNPQHIEQQRRAPGPATVSLPGRTRKGPGSSPGSLDHTCGARPHRGRSPGCWPEWLARPARPPSPRPVLLDRRPGPPWRALRTPRSARETWPRRRAPRPWLRTFVKSSAEARRESNRFGQGRSWNYLTNSGAARARAFGNASPPAPFAPRNSHEQDGHEQATAIQSSAPGLAKTGVASAVSKRGIPRGFVSSISAAAIRLISVSKRNARRRSAHSIRKMVGCRFSTIRWITMPSEYCPLVVVKRTRSPRENGRFMVSPSWRKWSRQCIVLGVLPLRMLPEKPLLSGPILKKLLELVNGTGMVQGLGRALRAMAPSAKRPRKSSASSSSARKRAAPGIVTRRS